MGLKSDIGNNRLVRVLSAAVLAIVAITSFRKGNRAKGALAGAGAVALGYEATNSTPDLGESIGIGETTDEGAQLRCAVCGEPIVAGQARGPNAEGETVHDACR